MPTDLKAPWIAGYKAATTTADGLWATDKNQYVFISNLQAFVASEGEPHAIGSVSERVWSLPAQHLLLLMSTNPLAVCEELLACQFIAQHLKRCENDILAK